MNYSYVSTWSPTVCTTCTTEPQACKKSATSIVARTSSWRLTRWMYPSNCQKYSAARAPTLAFHLSGTRCHGRWFWRRNYAHRTTIFGQCDCNRYSLMLFRSWIRSKQVSLWRKESCHFVGTHWVPCAVLDCLDKSWFSCEKLDSESKKNRGYSRYGKDCFKHCDSLQMVYLSPRQDCQEEETVQSPLWLVMERFRCFVRPPVLLFQPKYRLAHPENQLFLLSKKIFCGSKYPKKYFI